MSFYNIGNTIHQYFDKSVVTDETIHLLNQYLLLLCKWNKKINLIGKSTIKDLYVRHIVDSLQLHSFIPKNSVIIDVGTGAGFPGLILGLLNNYKVMLVEKVEKKCIFLDYVIAELGIKNITVHNSNIESIDLECDYIVSRAVTNISNFISITSSIKFEYMLMLKSKSVQKEIENAMIQKQILKTEYDLFDGISDTNSIIFKLVKKKINHDR